MPNGWVNKVAGPPNTDPGLAINILSFLVTSSLPVIVDLSVRFSELKTQNNDDYFTKLDVWRTKRESSMLSDDT